MPIYAYRCDACGFEKDALQKISDPPLTVCPACGQSSFSKKLTAPNFQLKGSGWYVTDFRDGGKKPADAGKGEEGKGDTDKGGDAAVGGKTADTGAAESGKSGDASGASTPAASPAPASTGAASPSPSPAGGASSSSSNKAA